jgi:hypothetical protein
MAVALDVYHDGVINVTHLSAEVHTRRCGRVSNPGPSLAVKGSFG